VMQRRRWEGGGKRGDGAAVMGGTPDHSGGDERQAKLEWW
jgi:hypothetical protein